MVALNSASFNIIDNVHKDSFRVSSQRFVSLPKDTVKKLASFYDNTDLFTQYSLGKVNVWESYIGLFHLSPQNRAVIYWVLGNRRETRLCILINGKRRREIERGGKRETDMGGKILYRRRRN